MQPRQGTHDDFRGRDVTSGDLIALLCTDDVAEHQREPALARVVFGEVTLGYRTLEPPAEPLVEGDLTEVGAQSDASGAAGWVVRGGFDPDCAPRFGVGVCHPVGPAHLAGADAPHPDNAQTLPAEHLR